MNGLSKISLRQILPFGFLAIIAIIAIFVPVQPVFHDLSKYNSADIV